jgi:hypothetical protein
MSDDELSLRIEAVHLRAMLAIAERDKLADTIEPLSARRDRADARLATTSSPAMTQIADKLGLCGLRSRSRSSRG